MLFNPAAFLRSSQLPSLPRIGGKLPESYTVHLLRTSLLRFGGNQTLLLRLHNSGSSSGIYLPTLLKFVICSYIRETNFDINK